MKSIKKIFSFFIIMIIVLAVISLLIGSSQVSWQLLIDGLFLKNLQSSQIIYSLRMPRLVLTLLVATALSVSGFLMQTVTQNRLASPTMLGLVDGAALGMVIAKFFHISSKISFPLICLLSSLVTVGLVYLVASQVENGFLKTRLVLIGIIIGNLVGALANIIAYQMSVFQEASLFFLGSVSDASWLDVSLMAIVLVIALPFLILLVPQLEGFFVDEELLQALGKPVALIKVTSFLLATVLTALSVSVVGKLNFIGLIVPNCIYLMKIKGVKSQVLMTILFSQAFLLLADILSKLIRYPYETPLSFVLSLIGLPFFFWLVRREGRSS